MMMSWGSVPSTNQPATKQTVDDDTDDGMMYDDATNAGTTDNNLQTFVPPPPYHQEAANASDNNKGTDSDNDDDNVLWFDLLCQSVDQHAVGNDEWQCKQWWQQHATLPINTTAANAGDNYKDTNNGSNDIQPRAMMLPMQPRQSHHFPSLHSLFVPLTCLCPSKFV